MQKQNLMSLLPTPPMGQELLKFSFKDSPLFGTMQAKNHWKHLPEFDEAKSCFPSDPAKKHQLPCAFLFTAIRVPLKRQTFNPALVNYSKSFA